MLSLFISGVLTLSGNAWPTDIDVTSSDRRPVMRRTFKVFIYQNIHHSNLLCFSVLSPYCWSCIISTRHIASEKFLRKTIKTKKNISTIILTSNVFVMNIRLCYKMNICDIIAYLELKESNGNLWMHTKQYPSLHTVFQVFHVLLSLKVLQS